MPNTEFPATPADLKVSMIEAQYEQVTRRVRWLTIIITLATFPPSAPQAAWVYALIVFAALYNLSRYVPALMLTRIYASRPVMMGLDIMFVVALIYLASATSSSYVGFLILILIDATYWFGLKGLFIVLAAQTIGLGILSANPLFPALQLGATRGTILNISVLFSIAYLVEGLTHIERDEREALLRLSNENQVERDRLVALVDSLNDATFVVDYAGRVLQANAAAQNLTDIQKDLTGRNISQLLPVNRGAHGPSDFFKIIKSSLKPQRRRDLSLDSSDGTTVEMDTAITPVRLGRQQKLNYIVVCRDITKEKSLDQQREEFISVASHELRTPLTIVEAAISTALLKKSTLPAETTSLLEQANRNVLFLAKLVQDLTTLSEAQNDMIASEPKPIDVPRLLQQIVKDLSPQAAAKQLELKISVRPDTPTILSTESHIYEILQNLVSNGIKYTKAGGVVIKAAPSGNGGILLAVEDSGIGISASDQRQLFTKFFRAEDYRTRETGGTGLGLYLCLELANKLNAKIWCKSKLNHGATFFLDVPPFSHLARDDS